jgi:hypothetical protein
MSVLVAAELCMYIQIMYLPPLILKDRHLAKWLCLLLGLCLNEQATGWLGLGLVVEQPNTEFTRAVATCIMVVFTVTVLCQRGGDKVG